MHKQGVKTGPFGANRSPRRHDAEVYVYKLGAKTGPFIPGAHGPKMTQSSISAAAVATAAPPKCTCTNLASMRAVGTGLS